MQDARVFFFLTLFLSLPACTSVPPVWQEDFSQMRDDVFSRLVRETHFLYRDASYGPMHGSELYFDRRKAVTDSKALWLHKPWRVVDKVFRREGGRCSRAGRYLYCGVSRYWRRIVNFAGRTRTSDEDSEIDTPGARLCYRFVLSATGRIKKVDVRSQVVRKGRAVAGRHYYPERSRNGYGKRAVAPPGVSGDYCA